jgi:hypothetical protein
VRNVYWQHNADESVWWHRRYQRITQDAMVTALSITMVGTSGHLFDGREGLGIAAADDGERIACY